LLLPAPRSRRTAFCILVETKRNDYVFQIGRATLPQHCWHLSLNPRNTAKITSSTPQSAAGAASAPPDSPSTAPPPPRVPAFQAHQPHFSATSPSVGTSSFTTQESPSTVQALPLTAQTSLTTAHASYQGQFTAPTPRPLVPGSAEARPGQARSPRPEQGRMRSQIACAHCRRSKVKCVNTGTDSVCKACQNQNRECTYPEAGSSGPRRESIVDRTGEVSE
jgi:hypothetical protein